jgi:hypothetical protein
VEASKKRKVDAYGKATGKHMKVSANKKAAPLKISVPKARIDVKRPSDVELALTKPVKRARKFALASSTIPASGLGGAGLRHLVPCLLPRRKMWRLTRLPESI